MENFRKGFTTAKNENYVLEIFWNCDPEPFKVLKRPEQWDLVVSLLKFKDITMIELTNLAEGKATNS